MQISMEKSIIDIDLVEKLAFHSSNSKHTVDKNHLGHKRESINVIKPLLLGKTLSNQSGLIPLNLAIWLVLHSIHPFTTYRFLTRWEGNERPSIVSFQCFDLSIHGLLPFGNANCLVIASGFCDWGNGTTKGFVCRRKIIIRDISMKRVRRTWSWIGVNWDGSWCYLVTMIGLKAWGWPRKSCGPPRDNRGLIRCSRKRTRCIRCRQWNISSIRKILNILIKIMMNLDNSIIRKSWRWWSRSG